MVDQNVGPGLSLEVGRGYKDRRRGDSRYQTMKGTVGENSRWREFLRSNREARQGRPAQ